MLQLATFVRMDQTKLISAMVTLDHALLAHLRRIKFLPVSADLDMWGAATRAQVKITTRSVTFFCLENIENQ